MFLDLFLSPLHCLTHFSSIVLPLIFFLNFYRYYIGYKLQLDLFHIFTLYKEYFVGKEGDFFYLGPLTTLSTTYSRYFSPSIFIFFLNSLQYHFTFSFSIAYSQLVFSWTYAYLLFEVVFKSSVTSDSAFLALLIIKENDFVHQAKDFHCILWAWIEEFDFEVLLTIIILGVALLPCAILLVQDFISKHLHVSLYLQFFPSHNDDEKESEENFFNKSKNYLNFQELFPLERKHVQKLLLEHQIGD